MGLRTPQAPKAVTHFPTQVSPLGGWLSLLVSFASSHVSATPCWSTRPDRRPPPTSSCRPVPGCRRRPRRSPCAPSPGKQRSRPPGHQVLAPTRELPPAPGRPRLLLLAAPRAAVTPRGVHKLSLVRNPVDLQEDRICALHAPDTGRGRVHAHHVGYANDAKPCGCQNSVRVARNQDLQAERTF